MRLSSVAASLLVLSGGARALAQVADAGVDAGVLDAGSPPDGADAGVAMGLPLAAPEPPSAPPDDASRKAQPDAEALQPEADALGPAPGDFPRLVRENDKLCVQFLDDRECVVESCRAGGTAGAGPEERPPLIVGAVNPNLTSCTFGQRWGPALDARTVRRLEREARANARLRRLRLRPATARDLLSLGDASNLQGWSVGFKATAVLGLVGGLGTAIGGAVLGNGNVAAGGFAGIGAGLVSALVAVFIDAEAHSELSTQLVRNGQEEWQVSPSLPGR